MKWTYIEIKNFLSITEARLQIGKQGLVLIEGRNLSSSKFKANGAGKSALFDSVTYALYDNTTKGLKADEVVNNKVNKNTSVILEGIKGADTYRIERYRKHTKHKNKVRLFLNDKEITGKSAVETNKMIEQIVGIDYNTFINSIMFSQGSGAGRFALATDKEKKEILEGLMKLGVYADTQSIVKDRLKAKEAEILTNKRESERLNWELTQVDSLEKQDKDSYEHTRNTIVQEHLHMGKVVEEMHNHSAKNYPIVLQLQDEIEQLKKTRDSMVNVNISTYLDDVNKAREALSQLNQKIAQLNRDKADQVNKYKQTDLSTNCPVCGNVLDTTHREQEKESIKTKLKEILLQLQLLTPQQASLEAVYDTAHTEYLQKKEIYDNRHSEYLSVVNDIQSKERWIQQYEYTHQAYKDKVESIKRTLEKLTDLPEPQPRNKERESIREKIKAQKEQLLTLEQGKQNLEILVKVYSNTGVKSHVLDLITPFLNERGNKYLTILSGPDMELKFDTQTKNKDGSVSDKFDLQVYNKAGGDDYKAQSEGEKKRADLSIALAIQDLVMGRNESQTNFVVYDEVFDALDEVGCENVLTLLKDRANTIETIFVITHSGHLKALFEKVITVVKNKNGESTLKEGAETS